MAFTSGGIRDAKYASTQSGVLPGQYVMLAVTDNGEGHRRVDPWSSSHEVVAPYKRKYDFFDDHIAEVEALLSLRGGVDVT